jgi:hypothetical protein
MCGYTNSLSSQSKTRPMDRFSACTGQEYAKKTGRFSDMLPIAGDMTRRI